MLSPSKTIIASILFIACIFTASAKSAENINKNFFNGNWISNSDSIDLVFSRDYFDRIIRVTGPKWQASLSPNGLHGANWLLSSDIFDCYYYIKVLSEAQMRWDLTYGDSNCYGTTDFSKQPEEGGSLWIQNGSIMSMVSSGDKVEFFYEVPTKFMKDTGVTSGTMKFVGTKEGQNYSGRAFVFTRHCLRKSFGYPVYGKESDDHRLIVLKGHPPRVDYDTCKVGDYHGISGSILEFKAYDQQISSTRATQFARGPRKAPEPIQRR